MNIDKFRFWVCLLVFKWRSSWFLCSDSKESACNAGDLASIPGLGKSLGEGNGNPLQYSCLGNPKEREAWWTIVHGVIKSQTRLRNSTATIADFRFCFFNETVSLSYLQCKHFIHKRYIMILLHYVNACDLSLTYFNYIYLIHLHINILLRYKSISWVKKLILVLLAILVYRRRLLLSVKVSSFFFFSQR